MSFESMYANPVGRASRNDFIPALIVLVLVAAFYQFVAQAGRNGDWVLVTLMYPGAVLLARRLQDMGKPVWLLLAPGALAIAAVWMHMSGRDDQTQHMVGLAAAALTALFMLWGLVGKAKA